MQAPYKNKSVLVTGGATRLGEIISLHLAQNGAATTVHFNSSKKQADKQAAFGERKNYKLNFIKADLTSEAGIKKLTEDFCKSRKKLDYLILNAAGYFEKPLEKTGYDETLNLFRLNAIAPLFITRGLLKPLRAAKAPVIIIIADIAGSQPWKNHSAYAPTKAAAIHLTKCLALELAPKIRVNAVAPGTVIPAPSLDSKQIAKLKSAIPLKSFPETGDILKAIDFIIGTPSVTGEVIAIDGGRHLI